MMKVEQTIFANDAAGGDVWFGGSRGREDLDDVIRIVSDPERVMSNWTISQIIAFG